MRVEVVVLMSVAEIDADTFRYVSGIGQIFFATSPFFASTHRSQKPDSAGNGRFELLCSQPRLECRPFCG